MNIILFDLTNHKIETSTALIPPFKALGSVRLRAYLLDAHA